MAPSTPLSFQRGAGGFAVPDLEVARSFYGEVLGLDLEEVMGMLQLTLPGGTVLYVYDKADHQPAVFTVLHLSVPDIEQAVSALTERGVEMLHYDGFGQDARGITRGTDTPTGGWISDPAGNIIAIMQE
jgi:predicted enzyme related to lactoylglutathione lyase